MKRDLIEKRGDVVNMGGERRRSTKRREALVALSGALASCGRRLQREKPVDVRDGKPVGVYVERDPAELVYVASHRGGVPDEICEGDEVFVPWLRYRDLERTRAEFSEFVRRRQGGASRSSPSARKAATSSWPTARSQGPAR